MAPHEKLQVTTSIAIWVYLVQQMLEKWVPGFKKCWHMDTSVAFVCFMCHEMASLAVRQTELYTELSNTAAEFSCKSERLTYRKLKGEKVRMR